MSKHGNLTKCEKCKDEITGTKYYCVSCKSYICNECIKKSNNECPICGNKF